MSSQEHLRLRALKRKEMKPKILPEIMGPLGKAQFKPQPQQEIRNEKVMKAQCKRLTSRTVVVGSTPFEFDAKGLCEVKLNGRGRVAVDFSSLLKMNGVSEVSDLKESPAEPVEEKLEEVEIIVGEDPADSEKAQSSLEDIKMSDDEPKKSWIAKSKEAPKKKRKTRKGDK